MTIDASRLGSQAFREAYSLKYAYLAGAMYRAIASVELVVALGKARLMGYFGTGGLALDEIERGVVAIQRALEPGMSYGINFLSAPDNPEREDAVADILLRHGVTKAEAAAFITVSPALVRYRLHGARRTEGGDIVLPNRVLAKVSRPEVATSFMRPAPPAMVAALADAGRITRSEAELSQYVPVASDVCVEADSGGHTDQGVAYALMPAMLALREVIAREQGYRCDIHLGAAGGIGTPHAAAAAFMLGADFVMTGSINQCTREAGNSEVVKDLLAQLDVQDTTYAPAGDMFELGAKVQVVKRGLFFAARANRLYELYQRHANLEEIDPETRRQIEERYFKRSFAEIWDETIAYYRATRPDRLREIEGNPRQRMAAVFKWYFAQSNRFALEGRTERKVDFQIHCGPALGAFNQWVKGTPLEAWRNRHVADIGERLMQATAELMTRRFEGIIGREEPSHDARSA